MHGRVMKDWNWRQMCIRDRMMDIEDAHKLKILTTEETKELRMAYFNEERQAHIQKTFHIVNDTNEQIAYLRSSVIGLLIRECTLFLIHIRCV